MITLSRKPGERIFIEPNIIIEISAVRDDHRVAVTITAPRNVRIYREELLEQILEQPSGAPVEPK